MNKNEQLKNFSDSIQYKYGSEVEEILEARGVQGAEQNKREPAPCLTHQVKKEE